MASKPHLDQQSDNELRQQVSAWLCARSASCWLLHLKPRRQARKKPGLWAHGLPLCGGTPIVWRCPSRCCCCDTKPSTKASAFLVPWPSS